MIRKNAIIIGASSGIGRELAKLFSADGYALGITARRDDLLASLREELSGRVFVERMDIAIPDQAMAILEKLIAHMGGVDVVVINAGVGFINPGLAWEKEKSTIDVNVTGFAAMANIAMRHFTEQGFGHIVGISSVAALRGDSFAPAYSASKAFMSNYLEALRFRAGKSKLAVTVTDIQPGFVDTAMAQGDGLFWVAPAEKAAKQIYQVIRNKRARAYVTRRWGLIAALLKIMPGRILEKFY
jgi:short-subunit dehydrogenase